MYESNMSVRPLDCMNEKLALASTIWLNNKMFFFNEINVNESAANENKYFFCGHADTGAIRIK